MAQICLSRKLLLGAQISDDNKTLTFAATPGKYSDEIQQLETDLFGNRFFLMQRQFLVVDAS